jgi:hypothetical protein
VIGGKLVFCQVLNSCRGLLVYYDITPREEYFSDSYHHPLFLLPPIIQCLLLEVLIFIDLLTVLYLLIL